MILYVINSLDNADDKKFIENLYNTYAPWLRFKAHKFVDDINICDDLVHDCMLNMIKYIETVKALPENKQRAYLAVAIDNISKNYIKRSSRTVTMNDYNSASLDFIPDNISIEDELEQKFDYETLRTCIDKLSDRDRDIITMKYYLGLSDEHIADVLQIKKDSVRMTVSRSIKKVETIFVRQVGK